MYSCELCSKSFESERKLSGHRSHHFRTEIDRTCEKCAGTFSPNNFNKHYQVCSGVIRPKRGSSGLKFPIPRIPLIDIAVSLGGNRWKCLLCEKETSKSNTLMHHYMNHGEGKLLVQAGLFRKDLYQSSEYQSKKRQAMKLHVDRRWGPLLIKSIECKTCKTQFSVQVRTRTPLKQFCSKFCRHSYIGKQRWGKDVKAKNGYVTICFSHYEKQCIICGFNEVVTVHHFDENHLNDDPRNLVPLCPNHHAMIHCNRTRAQIKTLVIREIVKKWDIRKFPRVGPTGFEPVISSVSS